MSFQTVVIFVVAVGIQSTSPRYPTLDVNTGTAPYKVTKPHGCLFVRLPFWVGFFAGKPTKNEGLIPFKTDKNKSLVIRRVISVPFGKLSGTVHLAQPPHPPPPLPTSQEDRRARGSTGRPPDFRAKSTLGASWDEP